jgi:hypothetical protein
MQQLELFTVAAILWGGVMIFLLYLLLKMQGIERQMRIIGVQQEENEIK